VDSRDKPGHDDTGAFSGPNRADLRDLTPAVRGGNFNNSAIPIPGYIVEKKG
jgi:hypothetical protein